MSSRRNFRTHCQQAQPTLPLAAARPAHAIPTVCPPPANRKSPPPHGRSISPPATRSRTSRQRAERTLAAIGKVFNVEVRPAEVHGAEHLPAGPAMRWVDLQLWGSHNDAALPKGSFLVELITEPSSTSQNFKLRHTLRVPDTPLTQQVKQWTGWRVQPADVKVKTEPGTSEEPAVPAAPALHQRMQVVGMVKLGRARAKPTAPPLVVDLTADSDSDADSVASASPPKATPEESSHQIYHERPALPRPSPQQYPTTNPLDASPELEAAAAVEHGQQEQLRLLWMQHLWQQEGKRKLPQQLQQQHHQPWVKRVKHEQQQQQPSPPRRVQGLYAFPSPLQPHPSEPPHLPLFVPHCHPTAPAPHPAPAPLSTTTSTHDRNPQDPPQAIVLPKYAPFLPSAWFPPPTAPPAYPTTTHTSPSQWPWQQQQQQEGEQTGRLHQLEGDEPCQQQHHRRGGKQSRQRHQQHQRQDLLHRRSTRSKHPHQPPMMSPLHAFPAAPSLQWLDPLTSAEIEDVLQNDDFPLPGPDPFLDAFDYLIPTPTAPSQHHTNPLAPCSPHGAPLPPPPPPALQPPNWGQGPCLLSTSPNPSYRSSPPPTPSCSHPPQVNSEAAADPHGPPASPPQPPIPQYPTSPTHQTNTAHHQPFADSPTSSPPPDMQPPATALAATTAAPAHPPSPTSSPPTSQISTSIPSTTSSCSRALSCIPISQPAALMTMASSHFSEPPSRTTIAPHQMPISYTSADAITAGMFPPALFRHVPVCVARTHPPPLLPQQQQRQQEAAAPGVRGGAACIPSAGHMEGITEAAGQLPLQLQQLAPPHGVRGLIPIYEFCGFKLVRLRQLHDKLVLSKAELEGECAALRLVLAAAKQTRDVQMLVGAVEGHMESFPEGIRSYRALVEALCHLVQQQRLSLLQGGRIAAMLLGGRVPPEEVEAMKGELAKCSIESPEDATERQFWIMYSCIV